MKLKHFDDYAIAFDGSNFALSMIIISVYTLSYAETQ